MRARVGVAAASTDKLRGILTLNATSAPELRGIGLRWPKRKESFPGFVVALVALVSAGSLAAQATRAVAPFTGLSAAPMASTFLKLPDDIHLGEVAGVARNSRGDIYV